MKCDEPQHQLTLIELACHFTEKGSHSTGIKPQNKNALINVKTINWYMHTRMQFISPSPTYL